LGELHGGGGLNLVAAKAVEPETPLTPIAVTLPAKAAYESSFTSLFTTRHLDFPVNDVARSSEILSRMFDPQHPPVGSRTK
jgi:hypothetical protein